MVRSICSTHRFAWRTSSSRCPSLPYATITHTTLIKGDARSATIAAASVLAKVHRDRAMVGLVG